MSLTPVATSTDLTIDSGHGRTNADRVALTFTGLPDPTAISGGADGKRSFNLALFFGSSFFVKVVG